ncbi:MAG: hypothetical protein ACRD1V_03725 [Vicinamibacterales bacterium]
MDLRPLTLAELLDRAFALYRTHVWVFAGIMALPAILAVIMSVILQTPAMMYPVGSRLAPAEALRTFAIIASGSILVLGLYFIAYAMALGATAIAVSQIYLGRGATIGSAYEAVKGRLGRLVLMMVWTLLRIGGACLGLLILAGAIAAVVGLALGMPGRLLGALFMVVAMFASFALMIFMGVRYGVSVPVAVLEQVTAGGALRRSVSLTSSNWWRVFLVVLCAMVVTYATALLLQGPFLLAHALVGPTTAAGRVLLLTGAVAGAIGSMFTGPVMIIGLVLIYYDLRIRKEAFDLHVMLEALDA